MAKDNSKSKKIRLSLTTQIFIGLFAGIVLGWLKPDWGVQTSFLRNIFLNLIKSIIAPLMFSTTVVGIAGGRNSTFRSAGRRPQLCKSR